MTDKEKIEKFLFWLKDEKQDVNDSALGSASSWNHGRADLIDKIYRKAKRIFSESKTNNNVS